jgi:pantoate--beta-alanine ligase
MGFFHEGHLTLMREGRKYGDCLVVSIFVNPTQFGPSEDLQAYPRDLDRDIRMADAVGVDVVFAPDSNDMYVKDHQTYVDLDILPKTLCGLSRPGHFRGVATVVTKLFNIVKPQVALFGEKDYQQLAIIRRMAQDLSVDIKIVGVPTVRETDGLAMSSRNTYLSSEERQSALSLFQSLQRAQNRVAEGVKDARTIVEEVSAFIGSHPHTKKDYVVLCDPETLADVQRIDNPSLLALAIMVGKTRLIDNAILTP